MSAEGSSTRTVGVGFDQFNELQRSRTRVSAEGSRPKPPEVMLNWLQRSRTRVSAEGCILRRHYALRQCFNGAALV